MTQAADTLSPQETEGGSDMATGSTRRATKIERFGDVEIPIDAGGFFDRYRMAPDLDEISRLPGVPSVAFFRDCPKLPVSFEGWAFLMPVFYYDMSFIQAVFLADLKGLKKLLPSNALEPVAVLPGRGLIAFTAFEYRVTDIDPYNEFAISVITERPGGMRLGPIGALASQVLRTNWAFVWKLPVTTELACWGGQVGYNYPKYVTELPFTLGRDTAVAEIHHRGAAEVRLTGHVLPTRAGKVTTNHGMSFKDSSIMDIPIRTSALAQGTSFSSGACRLEIGDGPIAEVLKALSIGRLLRYDYVPKAQSILPAGRRID